MKDFKLVLKHKMVWICALGYLVDIFDLVLFGIVRIPSLKALGISETNLPAVGAQLLSFQMFGLIAGGFVWGLWGDKAGRLKTLFSSIFLYSTANILNAFVTNVEYYALLRFLAGFGLAGELGIAVTLVAEILPKLNRGYGTTIIGFAGFIGAILASVTTYFLDWRATYFLGGLLGFILLLTRFSAHESILFTSSNKNHSFHQSLRLLFTSPARFKKYLYLILVGVPIWYVSGVLIYFAPEFSKGLNVTGDVSAGSAILWCYLGSLIGDVGSGIISQKLQSRKKTIQIFIGFLFMIILFYFLILRNANAMLFYFICFLLGIGNGYWTLLITMSAEHFGTNLRATVATSIPNLIRGAVIPLSFVFLWGKQYFTNLQTALGLGFFCLLGAMIALSLLSETFHSDLDYQE